MARTIAALDPQTGSRDLLVELHSDVEAISANVRRSFAERLFLRNVRVGMIITPVQSEVLRDRLSSMDFSDSKYEVRPLNTRLLFAGAKVGEPRPDEATFVRQVVQLLEAVGSSWYTFLHPSAVEAMVPDVVGNLAGANLEILDGLLNTHDAAE